MALERRGGLAAAAKRSSIATPTCPGAGCFTASTAARRSCTRSGIGPGAWVGLMLGNVPDFVILALALSKVDAVVVPLDPTTGEPRAGDDPGSGAAARAHHPTARRRGADQAAAGLPVLREPDDRAPARGATVEVRAREPPPPAGHAAHLQPLQARADREPGGPSGGGAGRRAVHRHRRRRSQRRRAHRRQPRRRGAGDRQVAGGARRGSRALRHAAPRQLRVRLRPAAWRWPTARPCSSRTSSRPSASPSCCASRRSICSPARPRCTARW